MEMIPLCGEVKSGILISTSKLLCDIIVACTIHLLQATIA